MVLKRTLNEEAHRRTWKNTRSLQPGRRVSRNRPRTHTYQGRARTHARPPIRRHVAMNHQLKSLLVRYRARVLTLLAALSLACSSPEPSTAVRDAGQSCTEIEAACHLPVEGLVQECHALGHSLDGARCTAQRSDCLAVCGAARASLAASAGAAGTGGSSGGGGAGGMTNSSDPQSGGPAGGESAGLGGSAGSAGTGAGTTGGNTTSGPDANPPTCDLHCACLADTCSALVGYPFGDTQACLSTCERDLSPALKCFHSFCTFAHQLEGDFRQHNCEHAWGAFGLAECF